MSFQRRRVGSEGETLAREYLSRSGHTILSTNWRCREGEIDLVAYKDEVLIFVEVKTRSESSAQHFGPFEAINWQKQHRLKRLARSYRHANAGALREFSIRHNRFDAIGIITRDDGSGHAEIRHKPGAF